MVPMYRSLLVVGDKAEVGAVYFSTGNLSYLVYLTIVQAYLLGSYQYMGNMLSSRRHSQYSFQHRKAITLISQWSSILS